MDVNDKSILTNRTKKKYLNSIIMKLDFKVFFIFLFIDFLLSFFSYIGIHITKLLICKRFIVTFLGNSITTKKKVFFTNNRSKIYFKINQMAALLFDKLF